VNRMQWLSVWGFNSSQTPLKTTIHLVCALPKVATKLVVKGSLAIFPRPLRPAAYEAQLST